MKTKSLIVSLLITPLLAWSQLNFKQLTFHSSFEKSVLQQIYAGNIETDPLALFLASDPNADSSDYVSFKKTLDSLFLYSQRRSPRRQFYDFQSSYLHNFERYRGISHVFRDSTYNCLTGTAVLGYLYQKNGFDIAVRELPYHTYLKINYKHKNYIVESTSQYGFNRLSKRSLKTYQGDTLDRNWIFTDTALNSNANNVVGYTVNNEINLRQLAGLLYYNQAVVAVNERDFANAVSYLEKAYFLYQSERIKLLLIHCLTIQVERNAKLDGGKSYLKKYKYYKRETPFVANND